MNECRLYMSYANVVKRKILKEGRNREMRVRVRVRARKGRNKRASDNRKQLKHEFQDQQPEG
jgi:hypothetical protein